MFSYSHTTTWQSLVKCYFFIDYYHKVSKLDPMSDYVEQLEQRNEELQELLTMANADAATYKWLMPRWRKFYSGRGLECEYYVINISYDGNLIREVIAKVYQTNGVNPNKTWVATFEKLRISMVKWMEFYATDEMAMQEVESMYMKQLRKAVSEAVYD